MAIPICFNASKRLLLMSFPQILILPLSVLYNPLMHFIVVDFPLPFGPKSPTISCSSTEKLNPFRIFFSFLRLFNIFNL